MTNLKVRALSGLRWNGMAMVVVAVVQFAAVAGLAHLLTPADFGVMAIVMIVLSFGRSFADMGMSNALIQRQDVTREELSTVYWFSILIGAACCALSLAATPLIVRYYNEPRLATPLYLNSLVFLIVPVGRQFQVLMQKELEFRLLSLVTIAGTIVNYTSALILAALGFGVISLVIGQLAYTAVTTSAFVYLGARRWPPHLHFSKADLSQYLTFGLYQTGESLLNALTVDIDKILVGKFLGASALGVYSLASQLVRLPVAAVDQIAGRVLYSVLALAQREDDAFQRGYAAAFHYSLALLAPVLAGLALLAEPFVATVYGAEWLSAVRVIQILCVVYIVKALGANGGAALLARGHADLSFYWKIFWTAVVATTCLVSVEISRTVEALAFGNLVAIVCVGSIWHVLIMRFGRIQYRVLAGELPGIVAATAGMALAVEGVRLLRLSTIPELATGVAVGGIVFGLLYRAFDRSHFMGIQEFVWAG